MIVYYPFKNTEVRFLFNLETFVILTNQVGVIAVLLNNDFKNS